MKKFAIIIIDDDRLARLKVRAMLKGHSEWEVTEFSNATEALTHILILRPDVIVSDIEMPGLNGYDFCRQVRRHHSLQELPIILLTAHNHLDEITEVYRAGANYYLAKGARVRSWLSGSKGRAGTIGPGPGVGSTALWGPWRPARPEGVASGSA